MTSSLLDAVVLVLGAIVLIPLWVFCAECWLALLPGRRRREAPPGTRPRVAILIPAHNEEETLGETLAPLGPELQPGDRIVVVADNCTDRTAHVARSAGATVVERHDLTHRGKGFALDFGVRSLRDDPPEVLIVLDADSLVGSGSVERLARSALETGRPVQARYCFEPPPDGGTISHLSALGLAFKNFIRPLGLSRIGVPCPLTGSGMAFPWEVIRDVPLATGNLVEDLQLGIDLALQGKGPRFCPQAVIRSRLPGRSRAFLSQRTRWEQGHLRTLFTQVPRLVGKALRRGRIGLLGMALDLAVPPVALLMVCWGMITLLAGAAAWIGGPRVTLEFLVASGVVAGGTILVCWCVFCRREIPWTTLLYIPVYMLRKLPIYAGMLISRQREWVRTERDAATSR